MIIKCNLQIFRIKDKLKNIFERGVFCFETEFSEMIKKIYTEPLKLTRGVIVIIPLKYMSFYIRWKLDSRGF